MGYTVVVKDSPSEARHDFDNMIAAAEFYVNHWRQDGSTRLEGCESEATLQFYTMKAEKRACNTPPQSRHIDGVTRW